MHDVNVVCWRAVQGLIAGQPVEAAKRIAAFDRAADFAGVRLKNGSFRPVLSPDPANFGVHVLAGAERCSAMRGGVTGGTSAVRRRGAVPCPFRRPSGRRSRRPTQHPCWAAVRDEVRGAVLDAVRSWALHRKTAGHPIRRRPKRRPMGGPAPFLACCANGLVCKGGAVLGRLTHERWGAAVLGHPSRALLGVRDAGCHRVAGGPVGRGGLWAVRGLAPP